MTEFTIAIPSKGRLKDQTESWLAACGFRLRQSGGHRGYRAALDGLDDVTVLLLSAREIAEGLLDGRLHFGITGEDLLHDLAQQYDQQLHGIRRLKFGGADMVVAVPESWIDVDSMADLEAVGAQFRRRHNRRLRVATKYLASTRRFFASHAIGDYQLVESAGATEAAPAAGTADLIVDITSTGATLSANGLKILKDGTILQSQAALTASLSANWNAFAKRQAERLLSQVEAHAAALSLKRLTASAPIPDQLADQLGLSDVQGSAANCSESRMADAAEALCREGLGPVSVQDVGFVFRAQTDAFLHLMKKI